VLKKEMTKIGFKELFWNLAADTITTKIEVFKIFELPKLCRNCTCVRDKYGWSLVFDIRVLLCPEHEVPIV
jgi:hypothetical protein